MKPSFRVFLAVIGVLFAGMSFSASAQAQTCAAPWTAGMSVSVGQVVSFGGENWKAIQPEISAAPNWQPPNVPALWSLVGACQAGGGGSSCTAVPSAPSGLAASNVTSTDATLSWTVVTPPSNCTVTGYTVFENGTSLGTTANTNFQVSGLTAGGTFTFAVAASDSAGSSAQSAAVNVTTPSQACNTVPAAPAGLSASSTTSSGTVLNWTVPSVASGCSVTGYTVFENGTSIGTTTATSFTVSGLEPATAFSFAVAARDAAGSSAQSTALSVTTLSGTTGGNGGGNGRLLIGYWHDFDNGSVDIPLAKVSSNFDVLVVAFGGTTTDTSTISFAVDTVDIESQAQFIADIRSLHAQNKKVLLSIGGANGNVALNTGQDVSNFVQSVSGIIQQFGFDGIDIDIENNSFALEPGDDDFTSPKTPTIVNMSNALHQLAAKFPNFMLTFAPQITDVQEANVAYASAFGDQLPLLWACRDIMSWVQVQDYNTGGTTALDGNTYNEGSADFLVAMTEMLVHGFTLANGQSFPGFPPGQVALGVPAGPGAAGSGVASPASVRQALGYLINGTSFGGKYVLQNSAGYPGLRGLMTWSVNWDQVNNFGLSNAVAPFLHRLPAIPPPK
jgi:chitinase